MILMLEHKQQFVNTDHITTAKVSGREERCCIQLYVVGQSEPITLHWYRNFTEAEQALDTLARAITEGEKDNGCQS
jgi:hypothetical protein